MPVATPSLRCAWPVAQQFTSVGARTGRARQNRFAQAKVGANGFPFARSLGRTHCQWLRRLRLHAPPMAEPLAPRLCGEWQSNRFANGLVRSNFAVRAPKAEQWPRTRPSASKNAPATGTGCERFVRITRLSPTPKKQKLFHASPCAAPPDLLNYCHQPARLGLSGA